MSKFKKHGMVALFICLCLMAGGCGRHHAAVTQHASADDHTSQNTHGQNNAHRQDEDEEEEQDVALPGTYTVPDGWVKADEHSTDQKFFYVKKGHEHDTQPDNISINVGKNRYSADEHEDFKEAIVSQLAMQIGNSGAALDAYAAKTKQGDVLYVFTITEDRGIVTKQYYVIGDRRYCLIQLTNYSGSDAVTDAADEMAESFTWEDADD